MCECDVGCKPGTKASLDVTLIYTFHSLHCLLCSSEEPALQSLSAVEQGRTNFIHLTLLKCKQIRSASINQTVKRGKKKKSGAALWGGCIRRQKTVLELKRIKDSIMVFPECWHFIIQNIYIYTRGKVGDSFSADESFIRFACSPAFWSKNILPELMKNNNNVKIYNLFFSFLHLIID